MSKEMYISSSPHETKVAVLEDDQLVEVYFERDTDVGLVGGIYKGRVSRVLPGMQSAFVDIGLERDAFLYVSDFYEDQEEYDKVFEEAEARATKFTTRQADATVVQAPPPAPIALEPPPPVAAEVAPPPPAPVAPPPVETPVATVAPPVPVVTPPAPRDLHDRRGFDPRRGRRRRHRGRPDFREGRHEDHRFAPPPRAEEPSTEPHAFEILPGESLAKYRNAPTSPTEIVDSPQSAEEERNTAVEGTIRDKMSEEDDDSAAINNPAVQAYEMSDNAAPQPAAGASEPQSSAVADESPAPSAIGAVLADAAIEFAPGALRSIIASGPTESARAETPASEEPEPAASAAATAEPEPVPASPASPSFVAEVAASYSVEGIAGPSSGEPESKKAVEVSAAESAPEAVAEEAADAESPSERAESSGLEEGFDTEEEISEEFEELAEGAEDELVLEGGLATEAELTAEGAAGPTAEAEANAPGTAPAGDSGTQAPGAPGDRTYTLREPNQRPRFAPRRRRGPGGPGGPDRGPRRFDKPRDASRSGGNHHPVQIAEVLKEGQEILVQIAKEPLGTKGARITSHVALPGRYLVFMPTIDHIGVSRKIASEEERLRLRNIILENKGSLTGGFIVRTAGQGRSEDEFKADLKFLSTLWAEIRAKSDRMKAPALIHRDLDLVQRLLRDLLTPDFKCVRVDSEIDYERVLDFVNRCQPALVGKVKLYSRDTPLYEEFGIQTELDKALKPKVWLKSGGYIVINQTEALVAIDVNTGKYVGKTNRLEDTIVKTNVDAVNEIVRQVRLRDLGGIIVIDFIDMDERKNRAKVVQALEEALRLDRAPTKVISFHDFGLVAVTRKRVKQSLERTLCEPCAYCTGSGWVKSVNTICNEILAEARKMAKGIDGAVMTLRVSPEVAKALKSREGGLVSELESLTKKDIIIKSDPNVHQERFEIY
jgi:Rne/Rng family ribonuclease